MDNLDLKIILEELKSVFKRQEERYMIGRDIARTLLAFMGAMMAIIFSLSSLKYPSILGNIFFTIFAIVITFIFIGMIFLAMKLLLPAPILGPIKPSENAIREAFEGKGDREVLVKINSDYLSVIAQNEKVIAKRNCYSRWIGVLMGVTVFLILLIYLVLYVLSC